MVHSNSPAATQEPKPEPEPESEPEEQCIQARRSLEEPEIPSKLERAKFLTQKVKATAQRLLEDNTSVQPEIDDDDNDDDDIFEDAAYNPQKILQVTQVRRASVRSRFHRGVRAVADAAKNPRRAITNTYTRKAATKISRRHHDGAADYDEALIDANDLLDKAVASSSSLLQSGDRTRFNQDVDDAQQKVHRIREQRESLRSAWILGRHVKRVKIVQPVSTRPSRAQFLQTSTSDHTPHTQWLPYIGHMALWQTRSFTARHIDDYESPPFDLAELANTVERLAVASTPWQSWLMEIRDVYMWTDSNRTAKWMCLFWILWYFQHTVTFTIGWIIYATICNKFSPTDLRTIRDRVQRAQDHKVKAQAWSELIQKHGKQDWVEPLIDEAGPLVQLQLGDVASFLEILQNFYRWERPDKTLATLFYFVCCFLVCIFTSMECCVKLVWFKFGCMFFFGFPIATHYPKYRHLVSPYYWVYWDIPNTAELAIIQLQEKAVAKDAKELEQAISGTEPIEDLDLSDGYSSDTSSDLDHHDSQPTPATLKSPIGKQESKILTTIRSRQSLMFRTVLLPTYIHSRLTITRTGFWLYNKEQKQFYPFSALIEIQKIDVDSNNDDNYSSRPWSSATQLKETFKKLTTLQFIPSGLTFIFRPDCPGTKTTINEHDMTEQEDRRCHTPRQELALIVSESDRDKIFSVILSWSNVKWQPLFSMDRRNLMGTREGKGEGNRNLDDAIKKAVKSL